VLVGLVATDACVQPNFPVLNVKHYSPMVRVSAITPIRVSMEVRVWPLCGAHPRIRVCVRGGIRGYDVSRVSPPTRVVTRVRVPMVGAV